MAELRLDGRVAVVTGAGRGIGREHALLLASRGARVVVNDLGDGDGSGPSPAEAVCAEVRAAGGVAVASVASVATEAGARSIVELALESFGRVDIVVSNAGVLDPKPFLASALDDFKRMMEVHYYGTVTLCHAAWPHMVEAGYGRIVNTISTSILGEPTHASYGGAKAAVLGLTLNLAVEGQDFGITANAYAPSAVTRLADASRSTGPNPNLELGRRLLPPSRAVPAALYLCHELCTLNGQIVFCGGGRTARFFIAQTRGYANPHGTPEDVAANIDRVLDEEGYLVYGQMMDEVRYNLSVLSGMQG